MNAVLNFDFASLFYPHSYGRRFCGRFYEACHLARKCRDFMDCHCRCASLHKKIQKNRAANGCRLILGLIFGNLLIKNIVARPRPFTLRGTDIIIKAPRDYSFPSGHTLASVISAYILWHNNRKAGIAAAVTAALIAFSRIYLYVHYPTDIIGGTLLGLLIGFVTVKISESEKMRQMFRKKP